MTLLTSSDYNENYYKTGFPLKRWFRNNSEYYLDRANKLFSTYSLEGKKVLDIGCAFGFTVADLRGMGVNAYGIDVSEYAVGIANSSYVTLKDARTTLDDYADQEFDLVIMCEFLHCLSDSEITTVCSEVERIAKNTFVIERRDFSEDTIYSYNSKTMIEWQSYDLPNLEIIWREEEEAWRQ